MNQTEAFLEALTKHEAVLREAAHTFKTSTKEAEDGVLTEELSMWATAAGWARQAVGTVSPGDWVAIQYRNRVRSGVVLGFSKDAVWVGLITPGGLVAEITKGETPNIFVRSHVGTGVGKRGIYVARRRLG